VNGYDGRPTTSQVQRADVLARELDEVVKQFNDLTAAQLPALNKGLQAKNMPQITVLSEQDWKKKNLTSGSSGGMQTDADGYRDRD
jgi:hypothetical protein